MPRQRPPKFKEREIVRVLPDEHTLASGLAGLTGEVSGHAPLRGGGWNCAVSLPRRRREVYCFVEAELESTGTFAPKPEYGSSIRIRVDPESGTSKVVDEEGEELDLWGDVENCGLRFFTDVEAQDPGDPDGDRLPGVVVAKVRLEDGSWRYGVLLDDEPVVLTLDRQQFWANVPTEPGVYLDSATRPDTGAVEAEPLFYAAAWHAPAPAFWYDQYVRVLDRAHTEPVVGRVGRVIVEILNDDMAWSYFVYLDDDPGAEYQYVTAAEEDLEATGAYGEGYNPPPDWLRN